MKILNVKQSVEVPEGVEASVKARTVTIKGARGTLVRSFRHLAVDNLEVSYELDIFHF